MTQRRVLITGITGTLGTALGTEYLRRGWYVIGVTRQNLDVHPSCSEIITSNQQTEADAEHLLSTAPDRIFANAGQIETEIGPAGEPLLHSLESITRINYLFPATLSLVAARTTDASLDVIVIGSVADCSPSAFGPVYHASKVAVHHFVTGTGPILNSANPNFRLRLYRPGAIKGPLSWAPVHRLNDAGYRVRKRRCDKAPDAAVVATHIAKFADSNRWVGTWWEPLSFRFFKEVYTWLPNAFYKLQRYGWHKLGKFSPDANSETSSAQVQSQSVPPIRPAVTAADATRSPELTGTR